MNQIPFFVNWSKLLLVNNTTVPNGFAWDGTSGLLSGLLLESIWYWSDLDFTYVVNALKSLPPVYKSIFVPLLNLLKKKLF